MKTDFSINVNVSIGVTSEVVQLVTAILAKQPAQIVAPGTVVSNEPQPEPQAAAKKTRKGKGEATAEASANYAAGGQQEAETPTDQPEPQPEAEAETNRELTEEDVREAMHKVRQRIEGENYKENTDSDNYKKYHRVLTQTFKNISALLGSDKPSTLPADQRAAFINEINALVVNEKGEITKPDAF
ncbi:hypothetical protein I6E23_03890 [Prevotella brevis]|nr:hypothetical protein [Xylanibacter brevis]